MCVMRLSLTRSGGAHRVSDPLAVGRNLRIVHLVQRVDVVRSQRATLQRARGRWRMSADGEQGNCQ